MKFSMLVLLLALMVGCTSQQNEQITGANEQSATKLVLTKEQVKVAALKLGAATIKAVATDLEATGMIDVPPSSLVSIHAPVAGEVSKHKVLPGAHIHKGELLCEVSHQDIIKSQQDYLELLGRLDYLSQEAERQQKLAADEATATKRAQGAVSEYKVALAQKAGLEAKLKLWHLNLDRIRKGDFASSIRITSPLDGYVRTVGVTPGTYIMPEQTLFEIVDKSHLHLELKVFEQDAISIKEGQPVLFTSPALGNQELKASVFLTGKTFDPVGRTVNIHAHLEDEHAQTDLMPGMYVIARIKTGSQTASVLPSTAIVSEGDQTFVFVKHHEAKDEVSFERHPVKVLNRMGDEVAVRLPKPIESSNQIVLMGASKLMGQQSLGEEEE